MKYIIALLIILGTAIIFTLVKWLDGKITQKRTGKSSEELKNNKKWLIISFIGGLIIGLLYVILFYI
ncbi:hypothetical protein BUZ77_12705 [Staphylococcus saprophyticus]|uniref:hypothetical protein n=1 Tax=Mammaliicoccus vitulinus TaxID=71237 RepID=UPI000D1E5999|nr:hypothetical protein [Mammaliicoccus vitulinus]PTI35098.1 hypothetical protein BU074_12870 [Mammaliicoccus vitulinus]PTJ63186.1 hypothetical protein BUZ77_12705 [Staphylococcus saprophyticus]UTI86346.1 hypothetical protein NIT62_00100 [Mammaliicoccus sciuri]